VSCTQSEIQQRGDAPDGLFTQRASTLRSVANPKVEPRSLVDFKLVRPQRLSYGRGMSGGLILIISLVLVGILAWGIVTAINRATARVAPSRVNREGNSEVIEPIRVNRAGIATALLGAGVLTVAVFLPRVESSRFLTVSKNTLIASGDGWVFVIIGVLVTGATYTIAQQERRSLAVFVLGAVGIAAAIYAGTGDRLKLSGSSLLGDSLSEQASPGAGIYAAGVGAFLITIGGAWLAGWGVFGPDAGGSATKRCPDCAESVLADARVCKHCGYRFTTPAEIRGA
jgi:hypothetical protein